MATQDNVQDTTTPPNKYPQNAGMVTIDAPPFKKGTGDTKHPKLDLDAPSIRSVEDAWNLCKGTESANKARSERATLMELEYTGQPPQSEANMRQNATSWQSNVSTGVMMGVVDPKVLQFFNSLTSQVYLTRSSLPTTWADWKKKSDLFDIHTTRLIQGWEGYSSFFNMCAKEVVLHGYGYGCHLDPYTVWPKFFKQDSAFVPEEAPQDAMGCQFFVVKYDYLLHEFIKLFKDEEAADDMGYDVDNCVRAANAAEVKNPREDAQVTDFRKFADFISDGTLGLTYATSGPRVVKTYLLWNQEYDGKVSFWIISRDDGKKLRFASKIYPNMQEVVNLWSFTPGNGHLHSSKGLGRMLIGNVKITEKNRNSMVDNSRMAGLVVLHSDSKDRNSIQPTVMAPFVVLGNNVKVGQQRFEILTEELMALDDRFVQYMQQAAGAYIVTDTDDGKGEPPSAREISEDAKREEETRDISEGRFLDQTSKLVGTIQKRAYSDDHIEEAQRIFEKIVKGAQELEDLYEGKDGDPRCLRTIVNLFQLGLIPEEIKFMRDAPPSGYAHTDDAITSEGILAVQKGFSTNPNIDQVELTRRSVEALAGPDAADALVLNNPDQTRVNEARRIQLSESTSMQILLQPITPVERDDHLVHGAVVMGLLITIQPELASNLNPDPKLMKFIELNLNHLGEHLAMYVAKGGPNGAPGIQQKPEFKQLNDFFKKFSADLEQVINIQAHAKAAAAVGAIAGPDAAQRVIDQAKKVPSMPKKAVPDQAMGSNGSGVTQTAPDIQQSQQQAPEPELQPTH